MKGSIFDFVNKIADLAILNIVFVLTCLPIVTTGPALTALYSVTLKMVDGQEGYVVRGYFKAFKENFKQSVIPGMVLEIICFILFYDAAMLYKSEEAYANAGFFVTVLAILFVAMVCQYIFALMARYQNSLKNTLINAFLLAISKLPKTILMLLFEIFCVVLCYLTIFGYLYVCLFGCAFCAYLQSIILKKIFTQIEVKEE